MQRPGLVSIAVQKGSMYYVNWVSLDPWVRQITALHGITAAHLQLMVLSGIPRKPSKGNQLLSAGCADTQFSVKTILSFITHSNSQASRSMPLVPRRSRS